MDFQTIEYSKEGKILTVALNRPEVFNAFNEQQSYELQDALKRAKKDSEVRTVVITGKGKAFCSGQDLKSIKDSTKKRSLSESLYKRYNPIIQLICQMEKPVIGKLNGVAAGAGCSLALACDYIIASEKASLIEVFINVGLVLDSGSSYFLPRIVGSKKAFELSTLGTKVSASEALSLGLVNKVVPHNELDDSTTEIALQYAHAPTKAIAMIKKMLQKSTTSTLEEMLQLEAYYQEIAGQTSDYKEGVAAFNEKRPPEFSGK
ncbi:MAG: enoyl-CoA hydratase-related protein [Bacteroidota bacterium]|nr:enoyl-CoA hydratase-related protein [Bacteroidota bacterium]